MEALIGSWLIANKVSIVIVVLALFIYISNIGRIKALALISESKIPSRVDKLELELKGVRESVTYLGESTQKKVDCLSSHKDVFTKDESAALFATKEVTSAVIEKIEHMLDYLAKEIHGMREDMRQMWSKVN